MTGLFEPHCTARASAIGGGHFVATDARAVRPYIEYQYINSKGESWVGTDFYGSFYQ